MYAQAGIRALIYQEYLEVAATSNFWIPACAGMTVIESSLFQSAVKKRFQTTFLMFGFTTPTPPKSHQS